MLLGASALAEVLVNIGDATSPGFRNLLTILLAVAAFVGAAITAARRWRDVTVPVRRLEDLLPRLRAGQIAITELDDVGGALSPLVPPIRQLLTDLREQRMQNAVLQEEIRQRVLTRTDALERKIGSLQQQATRDGLTGLGNRRALDVQLPALIQHCRSRGVSLCLLMIDVDYFKMLNDTFGHAAGDELLRQIAQLIKSHIRQTDAAFRCGGDEFVVVLPEATIPIAKGLAERLRSLVDEIGKTLALARPPRLSIGVASLEETPAGQPADLLALADQRLYAVKAARKTPSRAA